MKKNNYLFILLLTCSICRGQNLVINGDFEANLATGCSFNLSNSNFNLMMSNCTAFGLQNEIDIQDSACTSPPYMGSDPASGRWFISLTTNPANQFTDALSLHLSTSLNAGTSYYISYFEKADSSFVTSNDSLIIGVSSNSLTFGTQIFSSLPAVQVGWTHKTFTFTSPITGSYLTISNKGSQNCWNFIDDFCLSTDSFDCILTTGINMFDATKKIALYPNPFETSLSITSNTNEQMELSLFDITARQVLQLNFMNSISFDTRQLGKGIYIYEFRNKNGTFRKGKIIKQ
jgi:hypothetical protein